MTERDPRDAPERPGPIELPTAHPAAVESALDRLAAARAVERIQGRDHALWRPDPDEIANRLGWLDAPAAAAGRLEPVRALAADARAAGWSRALLAGMGGSSLAPELFASVFGPDPEGLDLMVLDSTDPAAVARARADYDPALTLVLVSSKSGTTVETLSLFKRLWRDAVAGLGEAGASERFVAITDAGSPLAETAGRLGFRAIFLPDPDVGGRYSALTEFGLVPAALVGVDLDRLLDRARETAAACAETDPRANPGARLGAVLGGLAGAGRDKLTLALPPPIAAFGGWIEQLVAESTGKAGTGVLPVVEAPRAEPHRYGDDRLFVGFRLAGESPHDRALDALEAAGRPVLRLGLADRYDLGGQIFLWEFATAVAGFLLDVQPFDQPDVESAKRRAKELLAGGDEPPVDVEAREPAAALDALLDGVRPPAYVAVLAYLPPFPEVAAALERLRERIADATGAAVTAAFGPRYLHSTGQLHKGDAGNGRFLVLTAEYPSDVPIPDAPDGDDSSLGFRALERAQALGDASALEAAGRRVVRLQLDSPDPAAIDRIAAPVGGPGSDR